MNTIDKILEEFDMPSKHQSAYFGVVIAVDDNNDCYINSGRTGYGGRIYPGEMNSILDSVKTTMVKVYSERGTLIKKSEINTLKHCWLATHLESKEQALEFKRVLMGIVTNPIMSRKYGDDNFPMNTMACNMIRVIEHKLHTVSGLNQIQLSIPKTIDRIIENDAAPVTPRQTDYSSEDMSHLLTDNSESDDVDEVVVELNTQEVVVKNVYQAMPELDSIFKSVTIGNDRERNLLKQHINGWMADL